MSECEMIYASQSLPIGQEETELSASDLEREISEDLLELRRRANQIPPSQDREEALRMIEEIDNILFIHHM
jgi:hypothetical protein